MLKLREENEDNGRRGIGTATPIQIGMVIGFMSVFGGIVWGAATMNAKLDVVIAKIGSVENANGAMKADVDALKVWKAEVDRSGTKHVEALHKEFETFRTDFQIHVAQAKR
jgi:hypothetical protein